MSYHVDPKRRAAARWHALLNNGVHYVAVDSAGRIHAQGQTRNSPALRQAMRLRPDLALIHVDEQL